MELFRRLSGAAALIVLTGAAMPAQESRRGERAVELWIGAASGSPELGVLGDVPGQSLALLAVRASRRLTHGLGYVLEYTADLVPIALTSPPIRIPEHQPRCGPGEPCAFPGAGTLLSERAVYGVGGSPIGLALVVRPERAVQLSVGASAGALWFTERVPVSTATRFNFTAALGAALSVVRTDGRGLTLGYRFHHLSNAGTGEDNPGLASHVLHLGLRWRR